MSVAWQAWIYCDGGKHCQFNAEVALLGEGQRSPTEQRARLKLEGWRRYRGKDYCEECFEGKFHLGEDQR